MISLDTLATNIREWADNKGLINKDISAKQMLKVTEEIGEVAAAVARNDMDKLKDGIGDSFVTLIILAEQNGLSPVECLESAWDEIKGRNGKTINGVFIKESDLS
jgi:NTP pyrophosphatase (non-canonical NTP hydrolase)